MKGTDEAKETTETPPQGDEAHQQESEEAQAEGAGEQQQQKQQRRATAASVRRARQQRQPILPREQPPVYQGYAYNYQYAEQQQWGIAAVQNPYYW